MSICEIRDNKRSVSCFFSKFLFEHESLKKLCHKLIKHVWTGLQTRPDFQCYDRSGGTALESRPHIFNRDSTLSFGCGPRPREGIRGVFLQPGACPRISVNCRRKKRTRSCLAISKTSFAVLTGVNPHFSQAFYCGGTAGHVYCVALRRAPRRTVKYVCGALGRAPCIHARLRLLATKPREKCGSNAPP